jgi:pentatricopeptide repeat protein
MRPTKRQRHAVAVAVAIGLTVDQIATAIEMSRRSVYSHFRDELSTGRAKRLLANAVRLDAMAEAGNVSAAKYLHNLMMDHGAQSEADDDQWADVVGPISAQKSEFGKMN